MKRRAIECDSRCGPRFDDIGVSNNCNANTDSWTWVGAIYTNDTGLDGNTVFTGSRNFRVKEIEGFEITDSTALPQNTCSPLAWKYENENIWEKAITAESTVVSSTSRTWEFAASRCPGAQIGG
jgi:hypothetical protein